MDGTYLFHKPALGRDPGVDDEFINGQWSTIMRQFYNIVVYPEVTMNNKRFYNQALAIDVPK